MQEEIELKFTVPQAVVATLPTRLLKVKGSAKGRKEPTRKRLRGVYYDTPDLDLRRRGIALRVRNIGDRRVQTVKCNGAGAGPAGRMECEREIDGDGPDLTCVDEAGLQQLFSDIGAPPRLRPLFATDIDRTAWQFNHRGSSIECALDVGEIRANGKHLPVRELELELKGGPESGLFDAADALGRQLELGVAWQSKGQRGYDLVTGQPPEPPQRAKLKRKMTTGEALAAIVRASLDQIAFHAPLVRREGGVEHVHHMRVAVRKLRAALSSFRKAMDDRRLPFEDDLRWLQDQLGAVRNWDVFRESAVRPVESEDRDIVLVDEAAANSRAEAYRELCEALESARCTALWLSMLRWLRKLGRGSAKYGRLDRPIAKQARRELRRRARKLDKRGRRIASLDEGDLHKLRIGAKKLRYTGEFFRDLLPKKRLKRTIASLKALQDLLGNLNDARTARTLLDRLEPKRGIAPAAIALAHGDGVVEGAVLVRARQGRERLEQAWRRYDKASKPWD